MAFESFLRKLLAVALLLALLAAAWFGALAPLREAYASRQENIETAQQLLLRYRALAAGRAAAEAERSALAQRQGAGELYYGGRDVNIVAAELQQTVTRLLAESGSRLTSAQILPAKADDPEPRTGVRLRFITTVPGLQRWLHQVESLRPFIFVDRLDVRGSAALRTLADEQRRGPALDPSTPTLEVQADLSTFYAPGKP